MSWADDLSIPDQLTLKRNGYFTVSTVETGQLITIHRPGEPVEKYLCPSPGVANQLSIELSAMGLTGYKEGSA